MNDFDICIGIITSVYGVKGYVRLCSFTESPEDFGVFKHIFDSTMREYKIHVISARNNKLIVSVDGINSRSEAEMLRNTQLFVKRSELPTTQPDQFYHADLYGMTARLTSGEPVGIVKNVFNFGAGDMLEICYFASERIVYYPFTKAFVPEVNITERYLVLESIDEIVE